MKILIVEDEIEINSLITKFLTGEGFVVESVLTYHNALAKILDFEYDCIVLDLSLPDGDGMNLITQIKSRKLNTCIVVVSARNTTEDKINGLDEGADDYLSKPFSLSELNARIKSVLRRSRFAGNQEVIFHELKIYPESRQLFVNDTEVILTPKEYDLLCYFLMNKHRVMTKESIIEHLWGDSMSIYANSFDFIYAHIRNLRYKIGKAGGKDYLKSIYSIGYKFTDQ